MRCKATLESFLAWKGSAKPDQRFEYCRGFLPATLAEHEPGSSEMSFVRRAVVDAYLTGNFELVQQRHGPGDFSYYIVRRSKRDDRPRVWYRDEKFDRAMNAAPIVELPRKRGAA